MTFKTIETQEQFDEMVKDRMERVKEKAIKETRAEFSDYESMKQQIAELEEKVKATASEKDGAIKDLQDQLKQSAKEKDDMAVKAKAYELQATKIKVANAMGLPIEMAERLSGDDEESITADAESLKGLFGQKNAVPLGSYEDSGEPTARDHLRELLK